MNNIVFPLSVYNYSKQLHIVLVVYNNMEAMVVKDRMKVNSIENLFQTKPFIIK